MTLSTFRPTGDHLRRSALLAAATLAFAGCSREPAALQVSQLRPVERQFVERFIVLERARAVALADPPVGVALLDSLAAAWGDTADSVMIAGLATDPRRAALVHDLLRRLLETEADSLLFAPFKRRLGEPLPEPAPAGAEPIVE